MNDLKEELEKLDLENDNTIIEFINTMESDLYTGKNSEGEDIVVAIQKNVGMKISTYRKNNWIRINEYTIRNEVNYQYIEREEMYEKE